MGNEADSQMDSRVFTTRGQPPTIPCSVVWSQGHAYVLESGAGRCRWVGCDDRGRPQAFTHAQLQSRGWTLTRAS
jgi:hypothetical protein